MAALLPMSVAPRPPVVNPPRNRPGSAMTTLLPMRATCTAAARPLEVAPNTHTSASMNSARTAVGRARTRHAAKKAETGFIMGNRMGLLVAQGLDGIELGRLERRDDARQHADHRAEGEGHEHRVGRDLRSVVHRRNRDEQLDQPIGRSQAGHPPEQRNDRALDQNLDEDVRVRGANRLADADFTDALGDAGQHDVHDADAPTNRLMTAMMPPLSRALLIAVVMFSDQFSWVMKEKSSIPLCICIITFFDCCRATSSESMSATRTLITERRGSGALLVPTADLNFRYIVLSGI